MSTKFLKAFFVMAILAGCSGGGGMPEGAPTLISSGVKENALQEIELANINNMLGNDPNYVLTSEEIDELYSSGTITEEQKILLSSIAKQ